MRPGGGGGSGGSGVGGGSQEAPLTPGGRGARARGRLRVLGAADGAAAHGPGRAPRAWACGGAGRDKGGGRRAGAARKRPRSVGTGGEDARRGGPRGAGTGAPDATSTRPAGGGRA